ncbi:MAG TPA: WYL domain-containing protein [Pseudonocardiaceae bacterium]|nr:WYL domain-containing protein [Pseudonocardiaceae bacterium]
MPTVRAERLVNLVLCLLSTRSYLSAERIRQIVPGYRDAASDEAFSRMFERDKAELRDLGVPLETGRNSVFDATEGYRIARRDYELGDIDLEPDEAAAVALAVRLWDSPELTGAAHGALLKLRAAGVEVDDNAPSMVEPRVRTTEPAFAPLLAAVQTGRPVRFSYRRPPPAEEMVRTVEPWGVVSWRGRWYLVGHDRDRNAPRCFRLTRVVGAVTPFGQSGEVVRPAGVNLMDYVLGTPEEPRPTTTARLWVAAGRAQGLRRQAKVIRPLMLPGPAGEAVGGQVAGDELEIELYHQESAAGWIAGYGPDVVVFAPDVLRKSVRERLLGVLAADRCDEREDQR